MLKEKFSAALGILVSALILSANEVYLAKSELNASGFFDTRHAVAPGGTIDKILNRPTEVQTQVKAFRENGRKYLLAKSDFHVIYPIEMQKMISVIADYDNYAGVLPRVEYSEDKCQSDDPYAYHKQEQNLSIEFMHIGVKYEYVINILYEDLGQKNVFATKWNLEESLDGKLYELYGSWYLREFKYKGRTYTYVRYYARTGLKQVFTGLETLMKIFSSYDVKQLLDAVYAEAVDR